MPLVAGVDCSTQATKVEVLDADSGRQVAAASAPHQVSGQGGARETDPRIWREALRQALHATGRVGELAAISVAGQQHGLVVIDEKHDPLRAALLWNDTRSAAEATALLTARGAAWWAETVGVVPLAAVTVTKWQWLRRHEPQVASAATGVCLPHDWVNAQLTGQASTDRGDASGTGWWAARTGGYIDEILDDVGLDRRLLPPVRAPAEPAGQVSPAAANVFGLPKGIPVGPGSGDNMGAALGLAVGPGQPVVSLGTSGTAYVVSGRPAGDATGVVAGFADATGRHLPLACTLNCTQAIERVAGWLGLDRDDAAEATDVVVLPYFDGERTPNLPHASGMIVGARHDTTPQQLLLAAYEGAAASLVQALDALAAQAPEMDADTPITLVGGGARGRQWRHVLRRLSGRALHLPAVREHVALGAAMQSEAVRTGTTPEQVAQRWPSQPSEHLPPITRDVETLERISRTRQLAAGLLAEP